MTYFDAPYRPADLSLNSDAINNDLVGFWPLTDGSGTSAVDVSTGGNNGTQSGGVSWASSEIGTVASFDGSDDQFDISHNSSYNAGTTGELTVTAWAKFDTFGTYRNVVSKDFGFNHGAREWVIYGEPSGNRVSAQLFDSSGTAYGVGTGVNTTYTGVWYFLSMVWDGTDLKLFVDGSVASTASAAITPRTSTEDVQIGYNGRFRHDGDVQNVRVFNAALTAAQVEQLYTRPWTGTNFDTEALWLSPPASPTLSSASEATSIMTSCVGWWPLTEGSGTVATDLVGSNDGTLASSVAWESGTLGTATEYPSTPYEYTSTTLDLAGKSAVTVSAWIKNGGSSAGNGFGKIISQSHSGSFDTYMNKPSNASLAFDINSTVVMANNSDIPPIGTWFHVCFVWQQSTTQAIYINGELSNSGTADGSVIGTTSHDVFFGGTTDVYGNRPWDGGIQNVRIWDRALSSDEVAVLAERPWEGIEYGDTFHYDPPAPASMLPLTSDAINTNQVGWWPLTETDDYASGAADISGSSSTGTKSGGVTSQHSFTGASADFDNTGHIDVGKSFWDSGIVSANAFTFNAWFNVDNNTADHGIFGSWNSASEALIVWADVGGTNLSLTAICGDGTTQAITSVNAPIVTTGQWHMGTVIFDGSANTLKVYLDGVYSNENSSATATLTTAPMGFHIGDDGSTSRTTEGLIQNCRLWSRVLSADEIWSIYANPWLGSNYKLASGSTPLYNYIFRTERFRRLG